MSLSTLGVLLLVVILVALIYYFVVVRGRKKAVLPAPVTPKPVSPLTIGAPGLTPAQQQQMAQQIAQNQAQATQPSVGKLPPSPS